MYPSDSTKTNKARQRKFKKYALEAMETRMILRSKEKWVRMWLERVVFLRIK
jgi:hypothetical protein